MAERRDRIAAEVNIVSVDPDDAHAKWCLAQYYAELNRRFEHGFDPVAGHPVDPDDMRPPAGLFLLATLAGEPVACGVLRVHEQNWSEIKRLWVDADARGLGLGGLLLAELEHRAATFGSWTVRLDSNRSLREAIVIYRRAGYIEVPAFNENPYADHWFEKQLVAPAAR